VSPQEIKLERKSDFLDEEFSEDDEERSKDKAMEIPH